jgi:predicted alpha/beta superfamily hydrolase
VRYARFCLMLLLVAASAGARLPVAAAKSVQLVVLVPDLAADQPPRIFVASSADNWDERGRALKRVAPGVYSATLSLEAGIEVEYKFTRTGSWATVEKTADGQEMANRRIAIEPGLTEQVVVHRVARWADRAPPDQRRVEFSQIGDSAAPTTRPSTLTGNIRFYHLFHSPQLDNDRTIAVDLPPGYNEHPDQRYPVLYMHDGQNVFDAKTSFIGVEWRADETAEQLIRDKKVPPFIIVGIYNNADRISEYTPLADAARGGGRGDAYLAFIVETLKPFIDKTYRTQSEPEHTGIAGSSLGGLISLYAVYHCPDVFGMAGVMSPYLPWANGAILQYVRSHAPRVRPRIWIDIGTAESEETDRAGLAPPIAACRELASILEAAGARPEVDFHYEEVVGGHHNERDWAARLDRMIMFLLADRR